MKLSYEDANFYDGNIGKQEWKSSLDGKQRSFTYSLDGASRIKSGTYASTQTGENYSLNNVNYDLNGNITNLSRNGWKSNNTFGLIDNLNYTYQNNSNKIQKIDDASNEIASFKDIAATTDYTYYPDGSLKSDANKGITLIEYNYLKKQSKITFANGTIINYQYDASGKKIKETIGSQVTDYVGNTIYKNEVLYQISHDEGRIVNGIYEYNITDHLGNLRVAFKDSLGIAKIVQSNAYGAWGEDLPTLKYLNTPKTNNFGYLNREFQVETGCSDLVNRQFDNIIGRFTSQDPIIEGQEHLSLYQYGWNNPVLRSDPNGLMPDEPWYKRILPKTVTLETTGSIGLQVGAKASINNYEVKADANLVSLKVFSDKIGVEKGDFTQKSTLMNGVVEAGKEAHGRGNFEVKHGIGVTAKVAGNEYGLGAEHTSTIDNHGNHIGDKTSYTVFEAKNKETLGKDENIVTHGNTSMKASASKSVSGNVKIERQNGQTDLKYNFGITIGAKAILGVELKFNISNQ